MNQRATGPASLLRRAKAYAHGHGIRGLIREAFRRYAFARSPYYIYVCPHTLTTRDVPVPPIAGFHAAMVTSNARADELARTHEDFRKLDRNASEGLNHGAVACCLYSGPKVASLSWVATTGAARKAIDSIGFPLDPAVGGAWTGRVHTLPEYERKGLFRFACACRFNYLNALGIEKSWMAIAPGNVPSHAMAVRLGCHLAGKGHVVCVLRWRWWRDSRLRQTDERAIGDMVAATLARTSSRSPSV